MRLPVPAILAMSILASAPLSAQQFGRPKAEARVMISEANKSWNKARVARDRVTIDRMLSADFYAQFPGVRMSKAEFLDAITQGTAGSRLRRFDSSILTVQPTADSGWSTIVLEKIEEERTDASSTVIVYSLFLTRDNWKRIGERWLCVSSTVVSAEVWREKPPFADWALPG